MAREVQRNRERRSRGGSLKQLPWRQYRNPYRPIEVLTEEQLEAVHLASLKILEDFGMEFLDAGARDRLRAAGARVDKDVPADDGQRGCGRVPGVPDAADGVRHDRDQRGSDRVDER